MKKLQGKVAIVTAATKGIGLACGKLLAQQGAIVYLGARSKTLAEQIIQDSKAEGITLHYVAFDVSQEATMIDMIETVARQEGRLDILVNNYGGTNVQLDRNLTDGDTDEFFNIVNNNLKSVYLPTKSAIPHMIQSGGGSIVNISSVGSVIPDLSRLAYGVSKSSINALTQNIALQYARQNIRCNAVLPGLTETKAAMEHMSDEFRSSFLAHVPLNRMGKPEDIAKAVLYFASEDSGYITGTLLEVAGGYGMGTPQYAEYMPR